MTPQIVLNALNQILLDIVDFVPRLVNGLIILMVGFLLARFLRWVVRQLLRRVHFDPLVERTGLTGSLRAVGLKMPLSEIAAQTVFVFLLLSFLISAARLMGLEPVAELLEQMLLFLPNLLAALIVFLLGGLAARFLADLVTTMAAGAGFAYAGQLGVLTQALVMILVLVIALGVLGIDTALLITAVTILIAAFGLALGLALGLGARGIVQHVLAGYYLRQRLPPGENIRMGEVQGQVTGIGGVNTVVASGSGSVIIPNTVLLESLVRVAPASPPLVDARAE